MAVLIIWAIAVSRNIRIIPSRLQSLTEMVIGGFYGFFSGVTGPQIKLFFPLLISLFLFIITANWIGLLPGIGTVGFRRIEGAKEAVEKTAVTAETEKTAGGTELAETENFTAGHETPEKPVTVSGEPKNEPAEHEESVAPEGEKHAGAKFVPLLRGATADVNTTLALAVVAVIAIQYFGFVTVGKHYSTRFVDISNPINFFIGALEIVSEFSKIISFAFRLFGNIFAGEVLLTVIAFLMPFIAPLPFLMLEIFVGFIQALVFSMLTAVFLNVAVSHGAEHTENAAH